ncbi:MAG: carbohydrate ABC transporter permease [Opitutales bacterium]|nr:carbohydrate ABC transporter permease [Opitutales bacterium]
MSTKRRSKTAEFLKHGYLWFILGTAFYPLFVMVVVSFKTNEQYQLNPWFFDAIDTWQWQNWAVAWNIVSTYIANSIVTSVAAVIFSLIMTVLTSYVLARYRFPGRNVVYYSVIASMFLPSTAATLVTLFALLENLNLINSLWALIIVGAAGGQVVGIFILKQFIEDIPKELFESAQIDGAGHLSQIRHIVLPMSGGILSTVAIMKFLGVWNNVILPLVIMRDEEKFTVPVGLLYLEGEYVKQWGEMMAGYAIASIPLIVLFLFTMRLFVKGLAAGAVKG